MVDVSAQLPATQLHGIFPAGTTTGSELEVTINGNFLDDVDRLVFSHDGITAKRMMKEAGLFDEEPQPIEGVFLVSVDNDVPPGRYAVRCQGMFGRSNPRTFVVSSGDEVMELEPNGENEFVAPAHEHPATDFSVPATINGRSNNGADVDWFRFQGKAGQALIIDGKARRIDSAMDLVMTLHNEAGQVIGESRRVACGDPLISAVLPDDGIYFVKVYDALYRSGETLYYRIEVGSQPQIDFVFPPVGTPGTTQTFTVYGNHLPGGVKSDFLLDGVTLERTTVEIAMPLELPERLVFNSVLEAHQGGINGIAFQVENEGGSSNPILIAAATAPLVFEQPDNDEPESAQSLTSLPCEVVGQFYPQRDKDWCSFEARKDEFWAIDVLSQQLGNPTDPSILIQRVSVNEQGEESVRDIEFIDDVESRQSNNNRAGRHEFDYRTSDPHYLFQAPDDGTYRILVKEGLSSVKNDPRLTYRLAIRRPTHDFQVVAVPLVSSGSFLLRRGGRQVIRVVAFRQDGFDGEIRVECDGLPEGVACQPIVIGPGNRTGSIILSATDEAPSTVSDLSISATAMIKGKQVKRAARYGGAMEPFQFSQANANIASVRSRLVDGIQLCVNDKEPALKQLTIGTNEPLETSRGGRVKIPYSVKTTEEATGNLTAVVVDLPPSASASQLNIGTADSGEFEIRLQASTPPGTYTFYLAGFNQGHRYSRNPEAAEKAKKRQERINQIYNESRGKTRDAQRAFDKCQSELTSASRRCNECRTKKQQADRAVTEAEKALKRADEDQMAAATRKLDEARGAAMLAEMLCDMADESLATAEEAKKATEKALSDAREFEQRAQQEKSVADRYASQKRNDSNPRNINFNVPSNSLTIKVSEFPIELESLAEAVTVQQGQKLKVPVKLNRLYGFNSNVSVQPRLPSG
ncbi:MAG: hypothetical protein AAGI63_03530, partial [Planctomycetota bacterium]